MQCLGSECPSSDSSWTIESGNLPSYPMMLASISCYLCHDSIDRADWHPVKILCLDSFLHQVCFGRCGFIASYYTFWTCFWEIKHYGNEFSASYWPIWNAFFSSFQPLLLPSGPSAPRLVILMHHSRTYTRGHVNRYSILICYMCFYSQIDQRRIPQKVTPTSASSLH